jgi:hypothetical protein
MDSFYERSAGEHGIKTGMKTIPENKVQAFQKDFILGKL